MILNKQVQRKMPKASKNRPSKQTYVSSNQPLLDGFTTPFSKHLNKSNRWVVLAAKIPWDDLVSIYRQQLGQSKKGASSACQILRDARVI